MARLLSSAALIVGLAAAQPNATITVNWSAVVRQLKTVPAFQTVVNSLTTRVAPQHDAIFEAIANLGAQYQRFVPWLPYPTLGVAELEPPSGSNLCGFANGAADPSYPSAATLDCGSYGTISDITFASYGTPTGYCGSLAKGSCDAPTSLDVVKGLCVGKASCTVPSNVATFGGTDPCNGVAKRLAVQATCSGGGQFTYYDFTWTDQGMIDFMLASGNGTRTAIPNFSTPPQWLYQGGRVLYPDDPLECFWSYESGNALVDPTAKEFGDYFGRLVAHFIEPGGTTDEYGNKIPGAAGGPYKVTHWEVLNEIEGEHGDSPQQYVTIYDAVVTAIKKFAPIGSQGLKFVGLALESDTDFSQATYFLNASNHAPGIPIDLMSFHFYAQPSSRDGGDHGEAYESFFEQAMSFIDDAKNFIAIRDRINPGVLIDADELGVILPDDNDPKYTSDAPGFPLVYWNAAAALYAFEFGSLVVPGLDVVGMSQLVGYPTLEIVRTDNGKTDVLEPQFPSVAMLNWTDGSGTARYWTLKLIIDSLVPFSDSVVSTTVAGGAKPTNPFCGSALNLLPLTLSCAAPGATINKILFADYGTPSGACGSWAVNSSCSAPTSRAVVEAACLGQSSCTVTSGDAFGPDPCYGTVKYLDVQASCSSGGGSGGSGADVPVFAQAFASAAGGKKLLVVSKSSLPTVAQLPAEFAGAAWSVVDLATGFGPARNETVPANAQLSLAPFAVGFAVIA